jgi:hypothetical protein
LYSLEYRGISKFNQQALKISRIIQPALLRRAKTIIHLSKQ